MLFEEKIWPGDGAKWRYLNDLEAEELVVVFAKLCETSA